jgi:hypothetical protein
MKGRIEIQRLADAIRGFRAAWKAAAVGKLVTPRHGTSFTSLEAACKVLTSRRPHRTVRWTIGPASLKRGLGPCLRCRSHRR